ncbi:MAG: Fic family protein [Bacteroidaceae bacterium]|nr:Fic family protein [Bacteroidaceae bacterium]
MSENNDKELYLNFDEYIRQGEPSQREAAYAWSTAIGLQAVDGLKTSEYLNDLARRNIEGEITIDEVEQLLNSYYENKATREADDDDKQEADKASKNIKRILSVKTCDFSTNGYIFLHRRIFEGVMKHAGEIRKYDITKREWVLEGDTVSYLNWEDLRRAVDYDIQQERDFSYKGISNDELVAHVAKFVSGLWQIHAFGEGNTRTTAVFTIQYLRSLGFNVENDLFAKHSWYFRNALVRANYKNAIKGIDYSPVFLERFFRNLLLDEQWDLRNRYLHINPPVERKEQPNLATPQVPHKYPTSMGQVQAILQASNPNIIRLLQVVGERELSVKEIMEGLELKDRKNVLNLYLNPAVSDGYVRLLYPNSPRHPRQKYLLTVKGMTLYNDIKGDK